MRCTAGMTERKPRTRVSGDQQAKGVLPLRFLVESTDHLAEVVDVVVRRLRSCSRFERSRVSATHHPAENSHFEERDELLLGVDLLASRRCRLHTPCGAKNAVTVESEQGGELAGARRFGCRHQGEHLHMPFAHLDMVAMPRNRGLHDLPVHTRVGAKLIVSGPLLQVEEIAEELERRVLCRGA